MLLEEERGVRLRIELAAERRRELVLAAVRRKELVLEVVRQKEPAVAHQMELKEERRMVLAPAALPVPVAALRMELRKVLEAPPVAKLRTVEEASAACNPEEAEARRMELGQLLAVASHRMVAVQRGLVVASVAAPASAVHWYCRPVWPFPVLQDSWRRDRPWPNRLN